MSRKLTEMYRLLLDHFGPQYWWPADTAFEVMVGAVLTQNTNWQNVSRALDNLRRENLLSFEGLVSLPVDSMASLIRPSGYFNLKAVRLKNLLGLIERDYGSSLADFLAEETTVMRRKLLEVRGIGPETADSILLYAAHRPVFVVDAYTHRILSRHGLIAEEESYHEIQDLFHCGLEEDVSQYNEYHALLVRLGKEFCSKSRPKCAGCPLEGF